MALPLTRICSHQRSLFSSFHQKTFLSPSFKKVNFNPTSRGFATVGTALSNTSSVVTGLFQGNVSSSQLYPFPKALSGEERETLQMLIDPVTKFFKEENNAKKNDEDGQIPEAQLNKMKEMGMFGLQVPQELNGLGASNTMYARLVEIVGRYDLGVGIALGAHQSIGFKGILLFGTPEQKAKYLPDLAQGQKFAAFCLTEPSSGSDANSIRTRAVKSADGSHYILNGSKLWISNGGIAEVMTVFAQTEVTDADGKKKDKVSAFIVERSMKGVTSGPPMSKMGIKCSNTAEVYYDNVQVPAENLIGKEGGGFKVAMEILNNGRFGMVAALTGTMKELISYATEHANNRTQFGKKLKDFPLIKEKLANMNLRCYAAESLAYLISGNMDLGAKEYQLEAAIGKIFASEAAWYVADETLQILGGNGYMKDLPIERMVRDIRIFRIFEGSNEILRMFVALTGSSAASKTLNFWNFVPWGSLNVLPVNDLPEELKNEAGQLNVVAKTFSFSLAWLLSKHKKAILEKQIDLRRIADAAIEIYASAAVISRAASSKKDKLPSADHEINLARAWTADSLSRARLLLAEITTSKSQTGDRVKASIADEVFSQGSYSPVHPLQL